MHSPQITGPGHQHLLSSQYSLKSSPGAALMASGCIITQSHRQDIRGRMCVHAQE